MKVWLLFSFLTLQYCGYAQKVYGSLKGTIVNAETNEPIASAQLKLFTQDSVFVRSANCSKNGKFNLIGIEKGSYYATVNVGGFEAAIIEDIAIPKISKSNIELKPKEFQRPSGKPTLSPIQVIEVYLMPDTIRN